MYIALHESRTYYITNDSVCAIYSINEMKYHEITYMSFNGENFKLFMYIRYFYKYFHYYSGICIYNGKYKDDKSSASTSEYYVL